MQAVHAVDLVPLALAEALGRVQAPDAFEQALAAQHLVAAGDAAMEIVGDVEEGRVAIRHPRVERQQSPGVRVPPSAASSALFICASCATALEVQTDQWPSSPPL